MEDIVIGLVALIAGSVFCYSGYRAFRVIIPIWGAFTGFAAGAGLISALTGDALLAKPIGWVLGLILALGFSVLAYLYYEVAVVLTMGSVGFMAGSALMTALGVSWNWLIVLVAVAVSLVFAVFAITTNFPRIVLVVVSATAGATAMVAGGMLLTGALETADLTRSYVTERIHDDWWWYLGYAFLVISGILSQAAANAQQDLRTAWYVEERRTA
ncbi:MAG: DUF4203 domain-containing protein [Microthrixaceae bacterium]|jgi:hypothetical protein|nr:DUF4203 domain-containing protein [Microthrixaceae bacterium]